MPHYNHTTKDTITDINLGIRVDRAAATHSGATTTYFTIVGDVLLTGLVGKVTVASGANSCQWTMNGTAGTTATICGALDIDPALVGDVLGITGVLATAMTYSGAVVNIMQPVSLTAGSLQFISAAADGATSWSLFYLPLTDGAYVVAA
jgi:hypothetical protein